MAVWYQQHHNQHALAEPRLAKPPCTLRPTSLRCAVLCCAGEDVVRGSGVPYAIVRPVALTEEPAGAELVLDQGDTIRGKISRRVLVTARLS